MALKVDCRVAAEESTPLADVALAWKSLHKAKEVLQRIENKFDHEDRNYAKAQKARKKLQCERNPDSNRGQEEPVSNEIKTEESCLSCRGNCASVSPAWPENWSFESQAVRNESARMMHLPCSREPTSSTCSPGRMDVQGGRAAAGTQSAPETLSVLGRRGSFSDQVNTGKKSPTGQMEGAPRSPQHLPSSPEDSKRAAPCAVWSHTPLGPSALPAMRPLFPCNSPSAQKQQGLRRRSPGNKLERLRERIREQKQRHQRLSQEAKQPSASYARELLPGGPLKRKVRKVACAPPAPVYRGFSAVKLKVAHSSADEETGISESEEVATTRQSGDYKNTSPDQRDRRMTSRSQRSKQEQSSSKSPVPKKTLKEKGSKLIGASAWREGQKLVKKLLGPPPKFTKLGSTSEEQNPKNDSESCKDFVATPQMEQSSRENGVPGGGDHMVNSPPHKSCQTTPGSSIEIASNALTRDAKQILRDLYLQNQSCEEYRRTKLQKDTTTGKAEDSKPYPETNPPSTEISSITRSDYSRDKTRSSLMKAGIEPRNCHGGKSASLPRSKGSNSPGQKVSEKENIKKRVNVGKAHAYSPEEVHEFMHRKVEERKKKNLEEKKSLKQARETRAQRLQELYRKQKEAFAKKSCSGGAQALNRGSVPATQRSLYKLAQEQTMKRSLERNFMEWVHKTSCALLRSEEQGSSDLHPKTTQPPKATETFDFPSSLASESGFLSPLNLKDLAVSPSPAHYLPPQSFFLPLKTAKSDLKASASEDTSSPPPYRNTQDRVKAIHSLARELGERIEMATERLRGTSRLQDSNDNGGEEHLLLEPPSWSSLRSKPKTPKSEGNRTMNIQTLLGVQSPNGVWISLDHAQDSTLDLGSPEGAEAQERKERIQSDTAAVSEAFPWSSNSVMHGKAPEDVWKGFTAKKESDMETCLLQGKLITSMASSSPRFLTRSPERKPANQRNRSIFDALSEAQNQGEIISSSPRRSLKTSLSHGFEPRASPTRRIEMQKEFEDDFGRDPRCIDPEERYRDHLENIQQTSLRLAHKLKADRLQQEGRLARLREKAKLEAQESQRSLDELLKHQLVGLNGSQASCTVRARLKHAKQDQREYQFEGDPERDDTAEDSFRAQSPKQSALKTEINCNVMDAIKATERKSTGEMNLESSTQQQGSLSAKHGDSLPIRQSLNPLPPSVNQPNSKTLTADDSGDSSEQMDSTSQWSEVSQFYGGSSTFCRFSLTMAEQYLREEELRARHQTALLRLREKALQEKTKAELAWLEHRKGCLENLRDSEEVSAVAEKQHKILTRLKQEQAEIQHLRNIYRAAHQERKLLLKQQREILLMQQSTAQLQRALRGLAQGPQFTNSSADAEEAIKQKTGTISSPAISSMPAEATAYSQRPVLSRNGNSCAQLNNTLSRKYKSFPTEKEKTSLQGRQQAELPQRWKRWSGAQDPEVFETMAKEPSDSSDQSTSLLVMDKDSENTEINALLHSEHTNSAEMDEATLTPVPIEDKAHEFLDSDHKEKKFVSNRALAPKDNEDINSHDSNATSSSVEELESDTLTMEKVHRVQGESQETAEDEGSCHPYKANDGDRGSGLISGGTSAVEAQTGKGRQSEEPRTNVNSKQDSDITYMGVKKLQVSEILPLQDVPVNEEEAKVSAPYEKNPAEDNQLIKHVDNDPCDPSDEEHALKTCSEGLGSTVSSTESHDSSLRCESVNSYHSLPEFHKATAVRIDVSESSVSDSELEPQDTDISLPEEFTIQQQLCGGDGADVFPNPLTKAQIAVSDRNELLSSDICDEQVPHDDCNREASSLFHGSEKRLGDVSEYEYTYESHSVTSSNSEKPTISASGREEPFSFQFDNTANGRTKPYLEASAVLPCSENCSVNKIPSQGKSEQHSDSSSSSLLYNDDFCTEKTFEQQGSATSKAEKDGESYDLSVGQSKVAFTWFPSESSLKHLDAVPEQFTNCVLLPPKKSMTNEQMPLFPVDSSLASRDSSGLEETKTNQTELLTEGHISNKPNEIASPHLSVPTSSEEAPTEAEVSSFDTQTFQRVAAQNQNNSAREGQTFKKPEMVPSCSITSKKQLPQARRCPSESEDDMIFISDEVLPPIDKDALSEILSPVDEVLSYGSVDLPSSNKKDLSLYSEDLPTPPEEIGGIKSGDISFSTEDFPSPPEQMTFSERRDSHYSLNEDVSGQTDKLPSLGDNAMPEELPPPSSELMDVFSAQDGTLSGGCWSKEIISGGKENLLEHVTVENETTLQPLGSLCMSSPTSSGQTIKRMEHLKKQSKPFLTLSKAQEDHDNPLLSFEVGDRVLVKHIQPGTLMFKGCTSFNEGYWAGVALDKPEGDHDGTYGGVKYFVCAKYFGIFVRPDQISHLLEDNEKSSDYSRDEDSFSDDGSSRGDYKRADDNQQGTGYTEQKPEDTYSARGSALKENKSRSHASMPSGKEHKGQFPTDEQYMSNEFICQADFVCLESEKETTELTQIKKETIAEGVLPMRNKDSNTGEVNKSKRISCLLKDQERKKLADDISSEITKKLLYDTLSAFSDTTEHKYKSAFERELRNHVKGLKKEGNHSTSLSERSAEVLDVLLCDFDTHSIHGPHTAQTVAEKIVTKFVDDAVKEYKKIKRKQGAKADMMFHLSSEIPQGSLPFLIKILDAGVFGSCEDFDQLNSIQHTKEIKTQRQTQHRLDHWHSAPWKKTMEVPLVVPHNSSHVKILSAHAVDELWTPQNICSNSRRINVPKDFECNDISDDDLEAESKRIYNQVIVDLTHELLHAEYQVTANPNPLPWLKENLDSRYYRHICRNTDISEVKSFIQGEIIKIMNLEKNSLEMKRKLLNMTKYGNCKRDRVDLILIQELHKEESQWTDYAEDELAVKMRVTEDIFDSLILDTIGVLKKISLKRTSD
ncbi:coiled-coil domain-containing protein 187 [Mauremys mutica]|uniref:coiled-coil domain-containing protein 187 n=1 Tax=Mauremys mutica TaxID=74926 RepID=UPI001D1672FC|nr:coiled-coil domain-containing protein 187 [Mauremys mutica]